VTLPCSWDPATLRPVYADLDEVRSRIADINAMLSTIEDNRPEWEPAEFVMRDELIDLHFALGDCFSAVWAGVLASGRARTTRSRKHRFLTDVRGADAHLLLQHYARATMLFIDLVQSAEKQPRAVRAMTLLRAGRCEYVQGMWGDARESFAYAIGYGRKARLGDEFLVEAEFALRCAEARLGSAAA
jgi:hypothetical protein